MHSQNLYSLVNLNFTIRILNIRFIALYILAFITTFFLAIKIQADTLSVAVASNFKPTLSLLAPTFHAEYGHSIQISAASTGKLYAQITRGAPFDVFLSADTHHVQRLIDEHKAYKNSFRIYTEGLLAVWIKEPNTQKNNLNNTIKQNLDVCIAAMNESPAGTKIAIANPSVAPYGRASLTSIRALQNSERQISLRLLDTKNFVHGENIAQTFQFIDKGGIDIGFIAGSQTSKIRHGIFCDIPPTYHEPLVQAGVTLSRATNKHASEQFWMFMKSDRIQRLIESQGYNQL